MFLLGLIVAVVIAAGGILIGSYVQYKNTWPWTKVIKAP